MPDPPRGHSETLRRIAAVLLIALLALSFCIDWRMVTTGGSIDYRNRITGARLLGEGIDPYHYKWRPGQPEEFCDIYNNLAVEVSKTTVTPTLLVLLIPFAVLPYKASQLLWLLAEWGLLLAAGILGWRMMRPGWRRWIWAAVVTGFSYSLAWRLHVDRGQFYILLTFLVIVWLSLVRSGTRNTDRWAGWIAGLLVCLRPPFLLILAPFLWFRGKGQWNPALVSLAIGLTLPMLFRPSIWLEYLSGMATWSEIYRADAEPTPPAQAYPPRIEGIEVDELARYHVVQYADSSSFRLLRECGATGVPTWPFLLVFTAGIGAWYWFSRRSSLTDQLVGIASWSFLADWFLPAYRNPYNDVLILAWMAVSLLSHRRAFWGSLLALPLGWLLVSTMPSARWHIHLPTLVFLVSALLTLFPRSSPEERAASP